MKPKQEPTIGTPSDALKQFSIANAPKAEPTVGQTYKSASLPKNDATYDTFANEVGNYYQKQATQPLNEKQIYRDTLRKYQAEIDATNKIYNDQLRQADIEGQGRLGSQTAMAARSGVLGSDFGNAQNEKVLGYNREITGSIQAERAARIAAIMNIARRGAADEAASKRLAKQQGAEKYLEFLSSRSERKQAGLSKVAKALITQGISPEELDPKTLDEVAKSYGSTPDEIKALYFDAKSEADAAQAESDLKTQKANADIAVSQAQIKKIDADIARGKLIEIGEGTMLYNTETGKTFKNPKTFAPRDTQELPVGVGSSSLIGQPTYQTLNAKQKTQADSLNNLVRTLKEYRDYYDKNPGALGGRAGNLFGEDSGVLQTKVNSIIFAAAQAEGTGALQQADREVIEQIIPNPSNLSGAFNTLTKGGKKGNIAKIDDQIKKYTDNLAGYGLSPVLSGSLVTGQDSDIARQVDAAGYDYDAMKADGLSDEEILSAIQNGG